MPTWQELLIEKDKVVFANPEYFWFLVPIAIACLIYALGWVGKEAAIRFSNVQTIVGAGGTHRSFRRWMQALIKALLMSILVLALARPQTSEGQTSEIKHVIDIMLAMDISSSMATLDFKPGNRLEAAKIEAKRFIQSRPDDRIGIVVFAQHGLTVSPLTTDHAALLTLVEHIQMGIMEDGTAIGVGLATSLNRLKESDAKSKVVVLLTDGVNNSGKIDPVTAGEIAKAMQVKVYTIGVGTDGIALVPVDDPKYGRRFLQSYTEIDSETMQQIAQMTGGLYFRAKDEGGLRSVFSEIDKLEKTEVEVQTFVQYKEYYHLFLQLALLVFVIDFLIFHLFWKKLP